MKESCVGAFARAARMFALAAVALGAGAGSLLAQSSAGKIEGRVRDQAGAPVASAQVVITGTTSNAVANSQGYYFINNVPAGTINVRAQFVGYKPVEVAALKVLAGQTITQDFTLEQTPIEITEITVTQAANALVPRDEVTTKQRVDGEYTSKLPVDRIGNVLALQPGVVASPGGGSIEIRGGRNDEATTYVDGVPVSPGYRGNAFVGVTMGGAGGNAGGVSIPTNGFEEASVTTGGQSAQFGNAQSGIIAIETKGGGSKYAGSVAYVTDEPFGVNHSVGFNRVEANIGGPVTRGLTFSVSGVLEGQKAQTPGLGAQNEPIFVQAGIDTTVAVPSVVGSPTADTTMVDVYNYAISRGNCDLFKGSTNPGIASNYGLSCNGIRTPTSGNSVYQLQGKINYSYGQNSHVSLTLTSNRNQGRNFSYSNQYDPQSLTGFSNRSQTAIVNLTQNLTKSTERALSLNLAFSAQEDNGLVSPLTSASEQDSRNPFGGFLIKPLKFLFDFNTFPVNDALIRNFRVNAPGTRITPFDLQNTSQYNTVDQYRNNAYGVWKNDAYYTFNESGGPTARLSLFRERRLLGRGSLDWQFDRYNRLTLGGEYTHYNIASYSSGLISQAFSDAYIEKPIRYNGFVEDRLDLGDVVVVGGLRYDFYDSRASRPANFPRVSSMPAIVDPNNPADTLSPAFDPNNPTALFVRDKSHTYVSPHVQVSFPVTERTNFRLSYAHQVQAPDFGLILGGINTDLQVTNTNHVYGSDLDFGKTITFEFGIRHSFSDDMVFDIAAYNKDKLSDAAGRLVSLFDPVKKQPNDIRVMTNADFGNVRGIDVRFDRRIGQLFNGVVAYTYEQAKNTGSDPFTYINFGSRVLTGISGTKAPPAQGILPTATSRPHNLAGSFSVSFPGDWQKGTTAGQILKNVSAFATFRYASGTGFTRCPLNSGNDDVLSGTVCAKDNAGNVNGSRLPSFKQFDLRVTKGFAVGGLDLSAYVDARNLLNFRNVLAVFTTTNDTRSTLSEANNYSADSSDFASEALKNTHLLADGSIDLTFGVANNPNPKASCGAWVRDDGIAAAPNCVSFIRTEERFGNGDHIFTVAEQRRASDALYSVARGQSTFLGSPRLVRVGLELSF